MEVHHPRCDFLQYRGTLYADYANRHWQSFNVDDGQARRVAPGGASLSARDANRQWSYRDINADVGGYVIRDRLWWYTSVRDQQHGWPALQPFGRTFTTDHQLLASRQDDHVRFDLINADEWHGGYITEHVSPDRWLIVYGSAAGRLESGAISATGSASVTLCQGSYDAICAFGGKSCDITDLRLTFTRK
jgi:hypothetical protein